MTLKPSEALSTGQLQRIKLHFGKCFNHIFSKKSYGFPTRDANRFYEMARDAHVSSLPKNTCLPHGTSSGGGAGSLGLDLAPGPNRSLVGQRSKLVMNKVRSYSSEYSVKLCNYVLLSLLLLISEVVVNLFVGHSQNWSIPRCRTDHVGWWPALIRVPSTVNHNHSAPDPSACLTTFLHRQSIAPGIFQGR